jgi:hypothetical protein
VDLRPNGSRLTCAPKRLCTMKTSDQRPLTHLPILDSVERNLPSIIHSINETRHTPWGPQIGSIRRRSTPFLYEKIGPNGCGIGISGWAENNGEWMSAPGTSKNGVAIARKCARMDSMKAYDIWGRARTKPRRW